LSWGELKVNFNISSPEHLFIFIQERRSGEGRVTKKTMEQSLTRSNLYKNLMWRYVKREIDNLVRQIHIPVYLVLFFWAVLLTSWVVALANVPPVVAFVK
jgi:hypothetical protein